MQCRGNDIRDSMITSKSNIILDIKGRIKNIRYGFLYKGIETYNKQIYLDQYE